MVVLLMARFPASSPGPTIGTQEIFAEARKKGRKKGRKGRRRKEAIEKSNR